MAVRIPKRFENMSVSDLSPSYSPSSSSSPSSQLDFGSTPDPTSVPDDLTPVPQHITRADYLKLANIDYEVEDEKIVEDIEYCWLLDCTEDELLLYCQIDKETFERILDANPRLRKRERALRTHPELLARQNLVEAIKAGDLDTSKWYLERKRPEEFIKPTHIDQTMTVNQNVQLPLEDRQRAIAEFLATLDVADAETVSTISSDQSDQPDQPSLDNLLDEDMNNVGTE